jgi:hypothetical protein
MLGLLRDIFEIFENIPAYILYAMETFINLIFSGVQAVADTALAAANVLPLPEIVTPPELLGELNWFFPVGAVISIATPLIGGYIAFIAIRWVLAKLGVLG